MFAGAPTGDDLQLLAGEESNLSHDLTS